MQQHGHQLPPASHSKTTQHFERQDTPANHRAVRSLTLTQTDEASVAGLDEHMWRQPAFPSHCSATAPSASFPPLTISPTTTSAPTASPAGLHQSGSPKAQAPPSSGRRVEFQLLPSSDPGGGLTSSFMLLAGPAPLLVTLISYWVTGVLPSAQLLDSFTCGQQRQQRRHVLQEGHTKC